MRQLGRLAPLLMLMGLACCSVPRDAGTSPTTTDTERFGGAAMADSLFFSMERTPCFGPCPAYTVQVYRSGYATFEGRLNTPLMGPHRTRLAPQVLNDLLIAAEAAEFFTLEDKYDGPVTDLPSTFVRVVANGKDKQVMGRHGQPEHFQRFALAADSLLIPQPWAPLPRLD